MHPLNRGDTSGLDPGTFGFQKTNTYWGFDENIDSKTTDNLDEQCHDYFSIVFLQVLRNI